MFKGLTKPLVYLSFRHIKDSQIELYEDDVQDKYCQMRIPKENITLVVSYNANVANYELLHEFKKVEYLHKDLYIYWLPKCDFGMAIPIKTRELEYIFPDKPLSMINKRSGKTFMDDKKITLAIYDIDFVNNVLPNVSYDISKHQVFDPEALDEIHVKDLYEKLFD